MSQGVWARAEGFHSNRKLIRLSDPAFRLFVCALTWSSEELSDGVIPDLADPGMAGFLVAAHATKPRALKLSLGELVPGLWHDPAAYRACRSRFCQENVADPGPAELVIHDYHDYQPSRAKVEQQREEARERKRRSRGSPATVTRDSARDSSVTPTVTDGGIRTESQNNDTTRDVTTRDDTQGEPGLALAKRSRQRDPIVDALAEIEGADPLHLTPSRGRTLGVKASEIRKATPDVTPDEIHRRAEIFPLVMPPRATLTAPALAEHWARCENPPVRQPGGDAAARMAARARDLEAQGR